MDRNILVIKDNNFGARKKVPKRTIIKGLNFRERGRGAVWRGSTIIQFKTAPDRIAPNERIIIAKLVGIKGESEAELEGVEF